MTVLNYAYVYLCRIQQIQFYLSRTLFAFDLQTEYAMFLVNAVI